MTQPDNMGDFSGTVKLVNISDFISPSQACVVNLNSSSKDQASTSQVGAGQEPSLNHTQESQRPDQQNGGTSKAELIQDIMQSFAVETSMQT